MMAIGKSKAKVYMEKDTKVTFADVAGVDEAKAELQEIVEFLRDRERYGRLGARAPKGILLVGPPGTGKTLLARAVAGEAGVPFYSINGSEFVELFVGVGAARVRDLFEQARLQAPAIIFIDELDALGRVRGVSPVGGQDEKEQTLNQLLAELDGFDPTTGLILLAATNRPEILDPALLRAGRFDRQVLVDRPDKIGRVQILDVHLKKIQLAKDVDREQIAQLTPGFSGADLANLVNEAALLATRRNADAVTLDHFTEAVERIVAGLEKRNRLLNPRERHIVAHHEMGHALVAMALTGVDPVHKVSIIPRGIGSLGYTIQRPTGERFLMTREELEQAHGPARRARRRAFDLRSLVDRRGRRSREGDRYRAQHGDALRHGRKPRPRDLRDGATDVLGYAGDGRYAQFERRHDAPHRCGRPRDRQRGVRACDASAGAASDGARGRRAEAARAGDAGSSGSARAQGRIVDRGRTRHTLMARLHMLRGVFLAALLAAGATAAGAQDAPSGRDVLASYVTKSDASYTWRLRARYVRNGAQILELHLVSQTWRDTPWQHQLFLIKPRHVEGDDHGVLIVGGGRWQESYATAPPGDNPPEDILPFVRIAQRLNAVVAVVAQVPYQPLLGLTEDRLIAFTFDQYLASGDSEWPLLLPMVKSAVRAMDAAQESARQEWGLALESFTVLGASKRGWTSWLTAAVDARVTAVIPIVIDAVNMRLHFPHQIEVWGAPSEEILPYTERNLHNVLSSEQGRTLREIVDPFSYRATLTQPKLIVVATNDRYFPVDSLNLYWDDLLGPKYILYVPNSGHDVMDLPLVLRSVGAINRQAVGLTRLPAVDWEFRPVDGDLVLCVAADRAPAHVRVWTATAPTRDFRDVQWESTRFRDGDRVRVHRQAQPSSGYAAVFAELEFGRWRSRYSLSTNVAMLGAPVEPEVAPAPRGTPGVCPAAG
jgi:PhoPQ-activated pathogenicity-related protein/AAA+ superfamily predicted ATPase